MDKTGSPPTTADFAASAADSNRHEIARLESRVKRLENTVSDLLATLAESGTIEVVDPDAHTRGAETLDEISDEVRIRYGLD